MAGNGLGVRSDDEVFHAHASLVEAMSDASKGSMYVVFALRRRYVS